MNVIFITVKKHTQLLQKQRDSFETWLFIVTQMKNKKPSEFKVDSLMVSAGLGRNCCVDMAGGGGSVRAVVVVELGLTSCSISVKTLKGCLVELFNEEKRIIYKWTLCISRYSTY